MTPGRRTTRWFRLKRPFQNRSRVRRPVEAAGCGSRHETDNPPAHPNPLARLEDLFGNSGACNGCWCMYWRLGPAYHERPRAKNKAALRGLVKRGPPPGLLAFDGDVPVGWCLLTPRDRLAWLNRTRRLAPVDDVPVCTDGGDPNPPQRWTGSWSCSRRSSDLRGGRRVGGREPRTRPAGPNRGHLSRSAMTRGTTRRLIAESPNL